MPDIIRKIRMILPPSFKWGAVFLCIFMAGCALLELGSMAIIMPIVSAFADPTLLQTNKILHGIYVFFDFHSTRSFIFFSAVMMIVFSLLKNLLCFICNCAQTKFSEKLGVNIAGRLYHNYIHTDYSFHLKSGPAELISKLTQLPAFSYSLLMPLLLVFSEIFVIIAILSLIIFVAPLVALGLAVFGFIVVFGFQKIFKNKQSHYAKLQYEAEIQTTGILTQSFAAIKEVKLSCTEKYFNKRLVQAVSIRNHAQKRIFDFAQVPRFSIEFFVVSITGILIVTLVLSQASLTRLLIVASVFIIAAFRLIPSISRIQYSLSTVRGNGFLFERIFQDLTGMTREYDDSKDKQKQEIVFQKDIVLDNITFRYADNLNPVIQKFSTSINACECIAFVGKTGAGKSTLADLIMGFFQPEEGTVKVDGVDIRSNLFSWRKKIGYVPQSIFLFDTTIRENIAFGIEPEQIEEDRLIKAMKLAQIYDFIQTLPQKEFTTIGNFGVRLSGGQRQRIAIARALYSDPELLILDEATSALDNETEKAVIDALRVLKGRLTIIMIAHRLSTLHYCDRTIDLSPDEQVKS